MVSGRGHLIGDIWLSGKGPSFGSTNPATGETVWEGHAGTVQEVDKAIRSARRAFEAWAWLPLEKRIAHLEAFAQAVRAHATELTEVISQETGKPLWESTEEVNAMIGKVALSVRAFTERRTPVDQNTNGITAATRYKPHGVLVVLGPFNLPGHLPNGHIVPALLAGNTVVFKPSELTPALGEKTIELWRLAGLPPGVLNLVQGGRETGMALTAHQDVDGVLFTGSVAGGLALSQAFARQPQKILALEMGGNNPLVVWQAADLDAAAYAIIQSAYITAGQRCTCARRLIVPAGTEGQQLIDRLMAAMARIRVGPYTQVPEPFMGPVISAAAAQRLLVSEGRLCEQGGVSLVPLQLQSNSAAMLSLALVDVTSIRSRPDEELFGPLLQVIRVEDFDAAITEANATAYGLAAGLLSDSRELYEQFYLRIRAGVVNWNRPTTGASGQLPFGGIGISGNHRPSGFWAADYCSYPIASLEAPKVVLPAKLPPGIAP